MVETVAWDVDAAALEDALLAVEREVVGVFPNDEVGDEVEGGESSKERGGRCGSKDGCLVWFVFATDFETLDNLANAAGGLVVEEFGDFVSDDFVVSRVGFVFGRIFGALFDG